MPNKQVLYKGRFFKTDAEFIAFSEAWPLLATDTETFQEEWSAIGESLWDNIQTYRQGLLNDELEDILSEVFLELTEKVFRKTDD